MHRLLLPLALAALTASAQFQNNTAKDLECENLNRIGGGRSRTCAVQEQTIGGTGRLEIGPSHNGSVAVKGWNQNTVLVRARVEAWGDNDAAAADVARQVRVEVTAGRVRAEGPEFNNNFFRNDNRGWSVSFEVFTPHNTDLNASTHNGAVNVELAGTSFDGQRLEVETHNGAVNLAMPSNYSARVEASTHNGGVDTDFPVTVSGRIDKRNMSFNLGSGGSPIRVSTHNGGIRIRRI